MLAPGNQSHAIVGFDGNNKLITFECDQLNAGCDLKTSGGCRIVADVDTCADGLFVGPVETRVDGLDAGPPEQTDQPLAKTSDMATSSSDSE